MEATIENNDNVAVDQENNVENGAIAVPEVDAPESDVESEGDGEAPEGEAPEGEAPEGIPVNVDVNPGSDGHPL